MKLFSYILSHCVHCWYIEWVLIFRSKQEAVQMTFREWNSKLEPSDIEAIH
jgi:hypothetical protein